MFPSGWPGAALLMLRLSMAVRGIACGLGYQNSHTSWGLFLTAAALATALGMGIFTPLVALASLGVQLAAAPTPADRVGTVIVVLNVLALCLIGPGAYSVDAHHFGRRLVVLPAKDTTDSDEPEE